MTNRQITLAARPAGFPKESDFKLVESAIPEPGDGQFLVQCEYLSVDPYMRGRMNDAKSYAEPVKIGEVMGGECVGKILKSKHPKFAAGSYVSGMFGWQEYAVSDGSGGVRRLDPNAAPISTALHCLGMPGLTAYFGLLDVCKAKQGDTVFVTGAAGAVGSVVGQIAKIKGCRVIGTAGSDQKIKYITDLGYDGGFNYKTTENPFSDIKKLCPAGIDCFFDNTGGPVSDAVFPLLNEHAHVGICGQISMYNATELPMGPRLFGHLIIKRATVQGLLVMDFAAGFRDALADLTKWYQEGKLRCEERITGGIENAPTAFLEMLQGANTGKQLVKLC